MQCFSGLSTRLGVTGRSGGGAYSWWVTALYDRIKGAVPTADITDLPPIWNSGLVAIPSGWIAARPSIMKFTKPCCMRSTSLWKSERSDIAGTTPTARSGAEKPNQLVAHQVWSFWSASCAMNEIWP